MAEFDPKTPAASRRYSRRSTKRRSPLRLPQHPGRILAAVIAAVAVIVLALVWGNSLKKRSDAHQAAVEAGEWTLDRETATPIPVSVPELRAIEILPEGNTGDILMQGDHGGILIPLTTPDGGLSYASPVGTAAGLSVPEDAPILADDISRIARRGFRVIGIFTVTAFSESDLALQTYRRGLELALLQECAAAGLDDILIFGLPAGDEASDGLTRAFLEDLDACLATLPEPPAVGVALSLPTFAGETDEDGTVQYAGNPSPLRILSFCDYLALDLRDVTADELKTLLPELQYAYVRHSLRLLTSREEDTVRLFLEHGFDRVFEMIEGGMP